MAASTVKFPDITVQLSDADGNIFAIGGRVGKTLKKAGVPRETIDLFYAELKAARSYDDALQVVMAWVDWE